MDDQATKVWSIPEEVCVEKAEKDTQTFGQLIHAWGVSRQPERAQAVLDIMEREGVAPDSGTFGQLIYAWGVAKQPERAQAVLEMMEQAGVAPDSRTFAPLIEAWGQARMPERAEGVLDLMEESGVVPDRRIFGPLIRAWGQAKNPERAEAVLGLMLQASVAPDANTFGQLITAWGRANKPERAEAVLDLMEAAGVATDSNTFRRLFVAWNKAQPRQPEREEGAVSLMRASGVHPDSKCKAAIAQLLAQPSFIQRKDKANKKLNGSRPHTRSKQPAPIMEKWVRRGAVSAPPQWGNGAKPVGMDWMWDGVGECPVAKKNSFGLALEPKVPYGISIGGPRTQSKRMDINIQKHMHKQMKQIRQQIQPFPPAIESVGDFHTRVFEQRRPAAAGA